MLLPYGGKVDGKTLQVDNRPSPMTDSEIRWERMFISIVCNFERICLDTRGFTRASQNRSRRCGLTNEPHGGRASHL
jgi:hypothetical protein